MAMPNEAPEGATEGFVIGGIEAQGPRLARLWAILPTARVVGGAVRDALAGRSVADVDLATPRTPEQVLRTMEAAGLRVIPTGLAHGTVTVLVDGHSFEVTTLRHDVRTDGRHAEVAFTDDWRVDAARRDFTFNALSVARDGRLYDYFGGADDLAAGRVRFVGDPDARITEDFLRVLRFFRFFARYARQPPDEPTAEALRRGVSGLPVLSAERVWSEMRRILEAPDPRRAIRLMGELGVLAQAVPDPVTLPRFERLVASGGPVDPILRLAALSSADPGAFVPRYRLSSEDKDRLAALRGDAPAENVDDVALRQALIDVSRPHLVDRTWLDGRSDALRHRIAALPDLVFPLQGRDLVAAGLAPGRELGQLLAKLRTFWRKTGGVATHGQLLAELGRLRGG